MFGCKVRLDRDLIERCKGRAAEAGYSSLEEFITHVLETELRAKANRIGRTDEEVKNKLRGLGYIQ